MCVGMYVESGRMVAVRMTRPLDDGASACVYYCVLILELLCVNGISAVSKQPFKSLLDPLVYSLKCTVIKPKTSRPFLFCSDGSGHCSQNVTFLFLLLLFLLNALYKLSFPS